MLTDERCARIPRDTPPLGEGDARELAREISAWMLAERAIEREFKFADFAGAMAFVNRVAEVAEAEDHHPDIRISYSTVTLILSTHSIGGLSMNDFILAAKIDRLVQGA